MRPSSTCEVSNPTYKNFSVGRHIVSLYSHDILFTSLAEQNQSCRLQYPLYLFRPIGLLFILRENKRQPSIGNYLAARLTNIVGFPNVPDSFIRSLAIHIRDPCGKNRGNISFTTNNGNRWRWSHVYNKIYSFSYSFRRGSTTYQSGYSDKT